MQAVTRALSEARTVLWPTRLQLQLLRIDSQRFQPLIERGSITITEAFRGSYAVFDIAAVLFLSLWIWRIWRFTISPSLNPEQPRELPYWIPVIGENKRFLNCLHLSILLHVAKTWIAGHTLSFVIRSQKLLNDAE